MRACVRACVRVRVRVRGHALDIPDPPPPCSRRRCKFSIFSGRRSMPRAARPRRPGIFIKGRRRRRRRRRRSSRPTWPPRNARARTYAHTPTHPTIGTHWHTVSAPPPPPPRRCRRAALECRFVRASAGGRIFAVEERCDVARSRDPLVLSFFSLFRSGD
jgi:hypothetical protein